MDSGCKRFVVICYNAVHDLVIMIPTEAMIMMMVIIIVMIMMITATTTTTIIMILVLMIIIIIIMTRIAIIKCKYFCHHVLIPN